MKLIFFGTADFSKPVFEALKKTGYSPTLFDIVEESSFKKFKRLNPDLCVVAAYGKIIPKEWLEIPKFEFLNVHPSLLPKYRGPSPIQTAILNGDPETGVTIILMDEKVDHGPIIENKKLKIKNQSIRIPLRIDGERSRIHQNYKELEKELAELGAKLLIEILPKWIDGKIKPIEQNHDKATYTKKFSWPDGKIDWDKSAEEVERQIRALNPEPGTWTNWNPSTSSGQGKILKILEAKIYEAQPYHEHDQIYIGVVYEENGRVFIPCSIGHIEPLRIQLEGKKPMAIKDFLNGHRHFIGSKLT